MGIGCLKCADDSVLIFFDKF